MEMITRQKDFSLEKFKKIEKSIILIKMYQIGYF